MVYEVARLLLFDLDNLKTFKENALYGSSDLISVMVSFSEDIKVFICAMKLNLKFVRFYSNFCPVGIYKYSIYVKFQTNKSQNIFEFECTRLSKSHEISIFVRPAEVMVK